MRRFLAIGAVAGLAILVLWLQPPSNTEKDRQKWVERVQGFAARELSCREVESE